MARKKQNGVVVRIYCDHTVSLTISIEGILRSIARQLVSKHTDLVLPQVKTFQEKTREGEMGIPLAEDWASLVEDLARGFERVYIFVDALVSSIVWPSSPFPPPHGHTS
jgi:hypothetical protein